MSLVVYKSFAMLFRRFLDRLHQGRNYVFACARELKVLDNQAPIDFKSTATEGLIVLDM